MGIVVVDLTVSLDGFIAGDGDGPEFPLGRGGERLFTWMSAGPESNRMEHRLAPPDASKIVVVPPTFAAEWCATKPEVRRR